VRRRIGHMATIRWPKGGFAASDIEPFGELEVDDR
jgi:hypothetical protein